MFKWISFGLQLLALKKTFTKSTSAIEFVERSVESARSYFLFTVGCIVASLFLLISLVVAVIGAGLQIENSGGIHFTGLMISATLFLVISVFFYLISSVALIIQRQKRIERKRLIEQERSSGSGITPLIEEILKQILVNLAQPKEPRAPRQDEQPSPTPTSTS